MLREVEHMAKNHYPDYELLLPFVPYRDMNSDIAVDQEAHSLIVAFPAFIKDYRKLPLSMLNRDSTCSNSRQKQKCRHLF